MIIPLFIDKFRNNKYSLGHTNGTQSKLSSLPGSCKVFMNNVHHVRSLEIIEADFRISFIYSFFPTTH